MKRKERRSLDLVLMNTLFVFAFNSLFLTFSNPLFGDEEARREYERLMKREEELVGYEPQSMFTPKGGSHGWDKWEQDELNRASGIDVPPMPPRDPGDLEGWGDYVKQSELHKIRQRKEELRRQGLGPAKAPHPKPTPKPKPQYGPFPEGDPRNNPTPKRTPPPPGVGPYGPEPLPAEDPNQLQANRQSLQFDGLLGKWSGTKNVGVLGHAFKQDTPRSDSPSASAAPCPLDQAHG